MEPRIKTLAKMEGWLPLMMVAALAMLLLAGCGAAPAAASDAQAATQAPTVAAPSTSKKATPTPRPKPARVDGMRTVYTFELPRQAQQTIRLIEAGGPFPFERDGITFQNRERILPNKPRGYYREYTVITPGSRDRGARRIVAGDRGELYYTDDHYDSFVRVYEP
jgi:ribonuclease T1